VQHDGGGGCCLVACPFAAIAGRPFPANQRRQIARIAPNKTQVCEAADAELRSAPGWDGRMSRQRDRRGTSPYPIIALLAQTSSSPAMTLLASITTQYVSKHIIKSQDYGTFMDDFDSVKRCFSKI
jgi:hypothetical protein